MYPRLLLRAASWHLGHKENHHCLCGKFMSRRISLVVWKNPLLCRRPLHRPMASSQGQVSKLRILGKNSLMTLTKIYCVRIPHVSCPRISTYSTLAVYVFMLCNKLSRCTLGGSLGVRRVPSLFGRQAGAQPLWASGGCPPSLGVRQVPTLFGHQAGAHPLWTLGWCTEVFHLPI